MSKALQRVIRNKIRFLTTQGQLSVEDLWDLPLTSRTGKANLNEIAKYLDNKITAGGEKTFVASESAAVDPDVKAAFDVVIEIIKTKEAEAEARRNAQVKAERRQKILAALENRENEDLAGKSAQELQAMLDEV